MYFVLCEGADASVEGWSTLIREQASRLGLKQSNVAVFASSSWHKESVGRQLIDQISSSYDHPDAVLVLSPEPWRSLLSSAPKPVKMDSGRVRFSFSMDNGKEVLGVKVEIKKPSPRQVLEYLKWLTKEVEIYAGI